MREAFRCPACDRRWPTPWPVDEAEFLKAHGWRGPYFEGWKNNPPMWKRPETGPLARKLGPWVELLSDDDPRAKVIRERNRQGDGWGGPTKEIAGPVTISHAGEDDVSGDQEGAVMLQLQLTLPPHEKLRYREPAFTPEAIEKQVDRMIRDGEIRPAGRGVEAERLRKKMVERTGYNCPCCRQWHGNEQRIRELARTSPPIHEPAPQPGQAIDLGGDQPAAEEPAPILSVRGMKQAWNRAWGSPDMSNMGGSST
ncbi:MAG: hypothetical protein AB7K24_01775 [Gemmataceae bacterium]